MKKIRKICVLLFIMSHTSMYLVGCTSKGQQQTGRSARQQLRAVRKAGGSVLQWPGSLHRSIMAAVVQAFLLTAGRVYTSLEAHRILLIEVHLCRPLAALGESLSNLCTSGRVLVNSGRRNCHSKRACFSFCLKGFECKEAAGFHRCSLVSISCLLCGYYFQQS